MKLHTSSSVIPRKYADPKPTWEIIIQTFLYNEGTVCLKGFCYPALLFSTLSYIRLSISATLISLYVALGMASLARIMCGGGNKKRPRAVGADKLSDGLVKNPCRAGMNRYRTDSRLIALELDDV